MAEPTRRSVLAGLGALGVTLAGCGSGRTEPPAVPEAAATGTARAGLSMKIARPAASAAETLDPASSLSAYEYLGALFNRLVKLDKAGTPVPDLAEEWSTNADGTRWSFLLRPNVRFHDGKILDAQDVVYSIRHILDPATASPQADVFKGLIQPKDVVAQGPTTVVFNLATPNAEFPSLLTAYQCYIIADGSAQTVGKQGNGTGPFRLEEFVPAGRGRITAFADHFAGPPALAAIDFYSIQDTAARVNALLAGQVDLLSQTNLDFATARVVEASPTATVARVKNAQWYTIPMLFTSAEFADPTMRRAMKLAYDPRDIVATALQGTGTPGWDNPVPPGLVAHVDVERPYDPELAKRLLKKAGRTGFSTSIYTSAYDPVFTPLAIAYRDSVKAAGIDLQITNASSDSYYTQIWMQKPLMVSYWFTGRPVDQLLNQIFRSGSSYNESAWSNPQFDGLLDSARAEMNDARRRSLYGDAQRLIVQDGADMTPMFGDRLVGLSTEVVNYAEWGFEFDYLAIGLR